MRTYITARPLGFRMRFRSLAVAAALMLTHAVAAQAQSSAGPPDGGPGGPSPIRSVTRTRLVCTLPAYAAGGNIVCTNAAGQQTTVACAANTACLVSAANPDRKTMFATNRAAGTTIDLGYAASVAPGNGVGIDGPATTNGQGGSVEDNPAHPGTYYAASASVATLVFVQGQ